MYVINDYRSHMLYNSIDQIKSAIYSFIRDCASNKPVMTGDSSSLVIEHWSLMINNGQLS